MLSEQVFFHGHRPSGHSLKLDMAQFSSLDQLKATLAEVFAFSDRRSMYLSIYCETPF